MSTRTITLPPVVSAEDWAAASARAACRREGGDARP